MKGETQADALASLVQTKKQYPEYELTFPSFTVKRSSLHALERGDVFLVGFSHLKLQLHAEDAKCANVTLVRDENTENLKITYIHKDTLKQEHTKKYETVKCSFGMLQSRKFEVDYKINVSKFNLEDVALIVNDEKVADAQLVEVDGEIAIRVVKVKEDGE